MTQWDFPQTGCSTAGRGQWKSYLGPRGVDIVDQRNLQNQHYSYIWWSDWVCSGVHCMKTRSWGKCAQHCQPVGKWEFWTPVTLSWSHLWSVHFEEEHSRMSWWHSIVQVEVVHLAETAIQRFSDSVKPIVLFLIRIFQKRMKVPTSTYAGKEWGIKVVVEAFAIVIKDTCYISKAP